MKSPTAQMPNGCASPYRQFKNFNMKYKIVLTVILISTFFLCSFAQTKKVIICLTYDDGLETQLSTVIPQLDSIGLKATFFLNAIQGSSQSDVIGETPKAVLGWTNAAK